MHKMSYRSTGSPRHSHKQEDKDKKNSSVYTTFAVMKPLTTYKIKELIYEKLIANGQLAILKHLLREHLYQSGWVYQFRKACLERLKAIGVDNVNVSHLVSDMVPVGRELFTQHSNVRQEIHSLILAYARMFIKTDPSALIPLEFPKSPPKNPFLLYQPRDTKPEPRESRKRPHQRDSRESRDHHGGSSGHKSSSKKSKTESISVRSRSRNSNHSRSSNRSHKGRSSSRSRSRSPNGIRSRSSTIPSPLPTRAIESQPPTLIPHSVSSHHTEKVQHHRKDKDKDHHHKSDSKKKTKKSHESSSSSSRDLHRYHPPPVKVQPVIPVKVQAKIEKEEEEEEEEEEELPDI